MAPHTNGYSWRRPTWTSARAATRSTGDDAMKWICAACFAAACVASAAAGLNAAENAKFRYLTSVYFDDKGAGLSLPEGVACGANGLVVVGDTANDRLLRFTFRDKAVSAM